MSADLKPSEPDRERANAPRNEDAAAFAALVAQWLMLLPVRAVGERDVASPARVRESRADARMLDDVAQCVAEFTRPPSGMCEFSIELRSAGVIDGRVAVKGGVASMVLRPRSRATGEFLAAHRDRLQRKASQAARIDVFIDIDQR